MDIKYFQLINAIVEQGSLSLAAERLNLTPSALSHQLKELESSLDSLIFHRIRKKMILTDEGEIFYKYGKEIISKINSLKSELQSGEQDKTITISLDTYTNYYWLSDLKNRINRLFPFLHIKTHTFNHHNSQKLLENGDVDIVISGYIINNPGYVHFPVKKDKLVLIHPKSPDLNHKDQISVFELNDLGPKIITHCHTDERSYILEKTFQGEIIQNPSLVQYDLTDMVIHNINLGEGFGIFSKWAVEPYIQNRSNIQIKEFEEDLSKTWFAIYKKNCNESFIGEIAKIIKETLEFNRSFTFTRELAYA